MNGEKIFEILTAYQQSEALKTAIELDIFTAVAEGVKSVSELSKKCQAPERGIRILCDYLVVHGLLTREGNLYGLTPESRMFLNRHSSAYFATAAAYWLSPFLKHAFSRLTDSVRQSGSSLDTGTSIDPDHPVWVDFARSMMPMMAFPAESIAKLIHARSLQPCRVLDIAAGHGLFGIAIAKQNPVAEITAVDWPRVLSVAIENANSTGVSERYKTIAGSAFDVDFGGNYDLALITNFLHHFDSSTCTKFLRKIFSALNKTGKAVILDFVANEDRSGPRPAVASGLLMIATTPAGDVYTFSEYEKMLQDAGFMSNSLHQIPPAIQQVIISKP